MEVPTSPHAILGEEVIHFNHPQHPLSQVSRRGLFTCSGCKEYGAGTRFVCQQCDFQLHEFCALAPQTLKPHPFHNQHQLVFFSKPVKGGVAKNKCDVCWKPTGGYTFRCNACSFQMHPCCAMLSAEIIFPAHPHPLRLLSATSASLLAGDPGAGSACGECKRRRSGRVYQCTVCQDNYYLHAVCAKSMVNGLLANGYKGTEKPSKMWNAARLATQAVKDFIGGLFEGIGEEFGGIIVQSVLKGRSNSRKF